MLSLQQRIFVCKTYFKYESARRVRDEFVRKFPGQVPPSRTAIHNIVNKFESTGSVENKKRQRKRTVLTGEKLNEIRANLAQSPKTSLPKLAQQVGVSVFSAHKATKLLKLNLRKDDTSSICDKAMEVASASDIKIEPHLEDSEDCPSEAMEVTSASGIKTESHLENSEDCSSEEPSTSTSPVQCEPKEVFLVMPKIEPDYPEPEESIKAEYPEYHSISPELCIDKESSENGDILSKCADWAEPDNIIAPGTRQFWCSVCNKGFLRKAHLRRHMPIHSEKKDFKCDICLKEFTEKCSLKGHLLTHSNEKPFQCTICSRGYTQKKSLKKHVVARHMERQMIHSCTVCGRRFEDIESLRDHLRSHIQLKKYTCKICSRDFCDKSGLNKHLVVHSTEKRFECPHCKKKFGRSDHLRNHIRVHTGERAYGCPTCQKMFSLKDALVKHLLVHSKEKK